MARSQDQDTVGSTLPDHESRADEPDLATFREPAERFELGDELGRGGMGRVIAATDVSLRRGVAIKQVLTADAHDLIRFEREVRITAQLEHPSIVPIYDVGLDAEDRPFYVMRRIDGVPLTDRLDGNTAARLALLPNVLAATDAAAFAHARKIIHRDIKPSNILLGAYGETWLIDWGLARRLDEPEEAGDVQLPGAETSLPGDQLTIAGHVYGTAAYMPPEQARGEAVDARADVYALGATLFHVLSGRGPFHGVSAAQRIAQAIEGESSPARLPDDTAPELRAIVDKAMAAEPSDRYADARALAGDLRAYLAGQLVGAHRYSARERFARFVRRNRLTIAVAGIATILIVIGATLAIGQILQRTDDAEAERAIAEERADLSELDRASSMVARDPTEALAIVRNLATDPRYARRVRDIAAAAAAAGVAHGSAQQAAEITSLAFSPDRRWLISCARDGRVVLYDVATTVARDLEHHEVGRARPLTRTVFIDNTRVALLHGAQITIVDIATSKTTTTDAYAPTAWAAGNHRLRYVDDKQHALVELDAVSDTRRVIASGIQHAIGEGENAVLLTAEGVQLMTPSGTITLSPIVPTLQHLAVAISSKLQRVAAAYTNEVIEWDFAGREVRRIETGALWPLYSDGGLFGTLGGGALVKLGVSRQGPLVRVPFTAPLGQGVAAITEDSTVWFLDNTSARPLPTELVNPRALATSGSLLAVGSADGLVRWWDTSPVWPAQVELEEMVSLCQWDAKRIYMFSRPYEITAVDRTTGTLSTAVRTPLLFPGVCEWLPSGKLLYMTPDSMYVLDLVADTASRIPCDMLRVADVAICARGRDLVQIGTERSRMVWRWPKPISSFGLAGHTVLLSQDDSLWRLDVDTGALDHIVSQPRDAEFSSTLIDSGEIYYSLGTVLWRWENGVPRYIATMGSPIKKLSAIGGSGLLVLLAGGEMWKYDGLHFELRNGHASKLGFIEGESLIDLDGDRLIEYHLLTNERTVHKLPFATIHMQTNARGVMVWGHGVAIVYDKLVPTDVLQVPGWIDRATNARYDRSSGQLTWPAP